MASFVEEATLRVKDESSAQIKKINAELKKLFQTANSLKSIKVDIKVNDKGITQAIGNINRLKSAMRGMSSQTVTIKANASGLAAVQKQLTQLRAQAARPITGPRIQPAKGMPWGYTPAPPGKPFPTPKAPPPPPPGAPPGPSRLGQAAWATTKGTGKFLVHVTGGIIGLEAGSLASIGNQIGRAIGQAGKEGYKQADIADTKMALQQYSDWQKGAINTAVEEWAQSEKDRPYWNRAQMKDLTVESMNTTGGDPRAATFLAKEAANLAKVGEGMGQTAEQARQGALAFIKAGEQSGNLADPKTGLFNYQRATEYFDTMRLLQRQVGQEFTGQKWQTTVGAAGVSKYGLNRQGMITLGLGMEEMGSKAGTGLNEAIKNLSTTRLDPHKVANLEAMGLVTPGSTIAKGGTPRGMSKKEAQRQRQEMSIIDIIGKGAVDEVGLRQNVHKWAQEQAIPTMTKLGLDPTKITDIQKFAGLITSGKGTDFLTGIIERSQELARDIKQAESRRGGALQTDIDTAESGRIALTGLRNQFQSVLGEGIDKLEGFVLPKVNKLAGGLSEAAGLMQKGEYTAAAGAVARGLPTVDETAQMAVVAKATTAALGMMAPGLALKALTSQDPGVQAAGGAAGALIGAASDLSGAAAMLSGAALARGLPGGLPGIGLRGGPVAAAISAGLQASQFAGNIAANIPQLPAEYYTATPERQEQIRNQMVAMNQLKAAVEASTEFEKEQKGEGSDLAKAARKKVTDAFKTNEAIAAEAAAERAQHVATIKRLEAEVNRLGLPPDKKKPTPAQTLSGVTPTGDLEKRTAAQISAEEQLGKVRAEQTAILQGTTPKTKRAQEAQKRRLAELDKQVPALERAAGPEPHTVMTRKQMEEQRKKDEQINKLKLQLAQYEQQRPKDEGVAGRSTDPTDLRVPTQPIPVKVVDPGAGTTPGTAAAATTPPPGGVTPAAAAQSTIDVAGLQTAAGTFNTAAATFSSAFGKAETAGQSLADGGRTAADTISSGASAAGSKYGAAAAEKISAAVANVSINVNHTGSPGGTGGSPGPSKEASP